MTTSKQGRPAAGARDVAGPGFITNFIAFARLVVRRFAHDGGMRIAASLSYTSLLAIVPLGTIAFAILKAFPVFDSMRDKMQQMVFQTFLPETISNVEEHFSAFVGKAGGLTAIGIVALAFISIMLLATIESALNDIFRVKTKRALVPRMMMFWAVLTMGPLLLGGSLSLGAYLFALTNMGDVSDMAGFGWLATRMLPGILAVFAFSMFYAVVPYRPVRVKHALVGGLAAGILFALVRKGFAFYVQAFPAYQTLYGALSTIPIFLIWMYLSWAVVLIGAEVTASLPEWGRSRKESGYSGLGPALRLMAAMAALEELWHHARGNEGYESIGPTTSDATIGDEALEELRRAGFVAISDSEKWLLARDLATVTVGELARGLGLAPDPADMPAGLSGWRAQLATIISDGGGWETDVREMFIRD